MIKIFEEYKRTPQVGDYVIAEFDGSDDYIRKYMLTHPGKISDIFDFKHIIVYDKYLFGGGDDSDEYVAWRDEILFFGTKEECEMYIETNKYNL